LPLTDREKEQLKAMIDSGQPLPPRFKTVLFDQPHEAELIWPGKTAEITNVVLPFQSIEQIDEPRAETSGQVADLFAFDEATGRQSSGWTNKLIWGDNKLVLASLKNGPLRLLVDFDGLSIFYEDPILPPNGYEGQNWQDDFQITLHVQDQIGHVSDTGNLFLSNIHRVYEGDNPPTLEDADTTDYFLGSRPAGKTTDSQVDLRVIVREVPMQIGR
jgi:adenine-specific DNA-methyltransferase